MRRETASTYLREAGITLRPPGAWGRRSPAKPANEVTTDPDAKPANEVTTDSSPIPAPAPIASASICEPFRDAIEVAVSRGRNAMSIWQSLVDEAGFAGGYQSVKRFVGKLRGPTLEACGVITTAPGEESQVDYGEGPMVRDPSTGKYRRMRMFVMTLGHSRKSVRLLVFRSSTQAWAELHEKAFRRLGGATRVVIETTPGEEAQVDYGEGPMVRDPSTGKYRRMRMFVLTLGHSRKSVRLLVFRSSTQAWAELHEKAFRRLGGATRVVVLDNLKEGVLTPDLYDPALNPLYRDVLKHYGAVPLPCRVNDPDRKGKVESGVGHAQKTPLKGLRFETPEAAQAYLDRWEERWADTRIHGTTKRQVAVMFAEEKPALLPLPVEPFRYYQYGERTVHLDGCVAYYGAPPGWIGRRVQVQWAIRTSACSIR